MANLSEFVRSTFFGFMGNKAPGGLRNLCWKASAIVLSVLRFPGGQRILSVSNGAERMATKSLTLAGRGTRIRASILHWGDEAEDAQGEYFPEIKSHEFRDAFVMENWTYQSAVVGQSLVIPRRESVGDWKLGGSGSTRYPTGVMASRHGLVWANVLRDETVIDRAAYVGTRSPQTWAHWLINFLPSVYLLTSRGAELEDVPLLVPSNLPQDSHWHESLQVVLGKRQIVPLRTDKFTLVRKLHWIDPPFYDTPFALDPSTQETTSLHLEVMSGFRETYLNGLAKQDLEGNLPRRFFLARGKGSRRPFNQREAIALARRYGIEPIYAENLSFWQKVRLFHQAELIVGPEGSGLANLIFSTSHTHVLAWWADRRSSTDNYLFNLAASSGVSYRRAPEHWTTAIHPDDGSYTVDLDSLESALSKL
jgi:capsular polysaccharide biosynthesis protein